MDKNCGVCKSVQFVLGFCFLWNKMCSQCKKIAKCNIDGDLRNVNVN